MVLFVYLFWVACPTRPFYFVAQNKLILFFCFYSDGWFGGKLLIHSTYNCSGCQFVSFCLLCASGKEDGFGHQFKYYSCVDHSLKFRTSKMNSLKLDLCFFHSVHVVCFVRRIVIVWLSS